MAASCERMLSSTSCPSSSVRRAVEQGADTKVADADAGGGYQLHAAVDAGHAPHVLVLKVTAVAVFHHLERQLVVGAVQIVGDTKLGGFHAALRVACKLAVHPNVEGTAHGTEPKEHLHAFPFVGHAESATVYGGGVTLHKSGIGRFGLAHHPWRVNLESVATTAVDGSAVAIHLPVARYGKHLPGGVVERRALKPLGLLVGGLRPMEFPLTIE